MHGAQHSKLMPDAVPPTERKTDLVLVPHGGLGMVSVFADMHAAVKHKAVVKSFFALHHETAKRAASITEGDETGPAMVFSAVRE